MAVGVFLAFAAAIATIVLRRIPALLVVLGLGAHILLPSIATVNTFEIARFSVHPGSAIFLFAAFQTWRHRRNSLMVFLRERSSLIVILGGLVTIAMLQALETGGPPALSFVVDQYFAPLSAFCIMGVCLPEDPSGTRRIRAGIIGLATIASAVSIAQDLSSSVMFFESAYAEQPWYGGQEFRWMGTLDHPLVLGMLAASAVPLLAAYRSWWVALPVLSLLLGGIAMTQSRMALSLGGVAAAYVLVRARWGIFPRLVLLGLAVMTVQSGVFADALHRFETADNSTQARIDAAAYFFEIAGSRVMLGDGIGASYAVSAGAGLQSSFENSFFMMTLDLGLMATILYFAPLAVAVVIGLRRGAIVGSAAAAVIAVVEVLSFSALGVRSAAAPLLWVIAALPAFGAVSAGSRAESSATVPADRRARMRDQGGMGESPVGRTRSLPVDDGSGLCPR